jgi:hypothetical protein
MNLEHEIDRTGMTLDPPGRIGIFGSGPLALEAALYGRFLGYEVTVIDGGQTCDYLRTIEETPISLLPSRALSVLAWSAIHAQDPDSLDSFSNMQVITVRDWLNAGPRKLIETDLLQDRILNGHRVSKIEFVEASVFDESIDTPQRESTGAANNENCQDKSATKDDDDDFEIDGDVPPDFHVHLEVVASDPEGPKTKGRLLDFEAVLWSPVETDDIAVSGLNACSLSPYFFTLADITISDVGELEESLVKGHEVIVKIYAQLMGRPSLDLYRPFRS